jgi:penicillin amidase
MKKLKKILFFVILPIIILLLVLIIGFRIYLETLLPDLDIQIHTDKVSAKVEVIRDEWGVPHVRAKNAKDAYFVYGYTIAQDRLFQMEMQRRLAKGELSEVLGKRALYYDKLFRTLLFHRTIKKYLKSERINKQALEILDAFIDGINYFIETEDLPIEFTLIGFPSFQTIVPKKFTRADCLAIIGFMAYTFADGIRSDSLASILKKKHLEFEISDLFPGYSKQKKLTIMENQPYYGYSFFEYKDIGEDEKKIQLKKIKKIKKKLKKKGKKTGQFDLNPNSIKKLLASVNSSFEFIPAFEGSNSWVIAPKRSKSGKALLANDMHIAFSNPGIWYEAHIKYPGYENYGYHLPLIPFPMVAHNKHKAWAFSMFENDDMDLYAEKFNPENKNEVRYQGKWVPVRKITEKIIVKQEDGTLESKKFKIRITKHGPIITDFLKGYKGKPVSLFWVFHQVDNNFLDSLYQIAIAKNIKKFEKGVEKITSPGINISYVDKEGNIAWWAAGKIIIHKPGVNTKEILDGKNQDHDVIGYLPFKDNPQLINPPSGIIVTANNLSTSEKAGDLDELTGYWRPSDRATRIVELLSEKRKFTVKDMKRIQTDVLSWAAVDIVAKIVRFFEIETNLLKYLDNFEQEVYEHLKSWNYENTLDSTGATIYHHYVYYLMRELILDEFGEENFQTYGTIADHWNFFKYVLTDKKHPLWDNVNTEIIETRKTILLNAFHLTIDELKEKFGTEISSWRWEDVHQIEFVHIMGRVPPMGYIYNIGPMSAPSASHTINNLKSNFTKHDYKVFSGPSNRRIIDYSNLENCFSILPTGNSGNLYSEYYDNQAEMFVNSEYRRIIFTEKQINNSIENQMNFFPE